MIRIFRKHQKWLMIVITVLVIISFCWFFVKTDPRALRGDGGSFDLKKYNDIVQNALGPLGFSEAQIEELAGDQICLDRVKELVSTGVTVSQVESRTNFEQVYSKFEVSVARFKTGEVANEVKISDDE